jgi:hypothetical protein
VGLLAIVLKLAEGRGWIPPGLVQSIGHRLGLEPYGWIGMLAFAALGLSLYHYARKPLEGSK